MNGQTFELRQVIYDYFENGLHINTSETPQLQYRYLEEGEMWSPWVLVATVMEKVNL